MGTKWSNEVWQTSSVVTKACCCYIGMAMQWPIGMAMPWPIAQKKQIYIEFIRNRHFAKLRNRLLASPCLSVRPHKTTRLPLDRFSCNLIFEYFTRIRRENSSFITIWQTTVTAALMQTFRIVSLTSLRVRNASNNSCNGNRTYDLYLIFCLTLPCMR
jgi:hypothetical protein